MNGVPNKLLSGQVTRKHTTLPRARLKAGIRKSKRRHEQRHEIDLNINITKDIWQAIQHITGAKQECPQHV